VRSLIDDEPASIFPRLVELIHKEEKMPRAAVWSNIASMADHMRITPRRRESLMSHLGLVDLVERIVQESGRPEGFDPVGWLMEWAREPNAGLAGATPLSYLEKPGGSEVIVGMLKRMQSGAF
jgi:hypothetical protein